MDPDHLPLGDAVWRDAFLIGGEVRLAEVAIASLLRHQRLYEIDGIFSIRRGDALDPTETIQRLVLNLVSLDEQASTPSLAKQVRLTEPVRIIEEELITAGLLKRQLGRLKQTSAGKTESSRVIQAHADVRGPRGVAYHGRRAGEA